MFVAVLWFGYAVAQPWNVRPHELIFLVAAFLLAYALINLNSGLALEAYRAGTANGTILDQSTYSGASNQQWNLTYIGGVHILRINCKSDKELKLLHTARMDDIIYVLGRRWKWNLNILARSFARCWLI